MKCLLLGLGYFASIGAVVAQVTIPAGLEPGQIQRELQLLRAPTEVQRSQLPAIPEQVAPPEAQNLRFVLQSIAFDGATVYSSAELQAAAHDLLNREMSVAELFRFANALTTRYRRDGYLLSQVLVPAQEIVSGHVRLLAVEGFIDRVIFRGDMPVDNSRLERYADALRAARPLTAAVLERQLLLINDLAGSTAHGTLLPSPSMPGAAQLVIDVQRNALRTTAAYNSRNSRSLGPQRVLADVSLAGVLGHWDQLQLSGGFSPHGELQYGSAQYSLPVGGRGASGSVSYLALKSRPGIAANLASPDLKTEAQALTLGANLPLLRSRTRNVALRMALRGFDGRTELIGEELSQDRVRTVSIGLTVDWTDAARGVNLLDLEGTRGLDILSARMSGTAALPLSRLNGNATFSKMTLYAARLQSLGGGWSVLAAAQWQKTSDSLLSPELFSFGGEPFGRGYDASELTGDQGKAVKIELRYASVVPLRNGPAYSAYAFGDWGEARRHDPINEAALDRAASWGLGMRLTSADGRWQGFVEFADPLDQLVASEGNRKPRIFVGLQFNL